MAKQQSAFEVTLEEKAVTGTPGVLDQLDLPPALITFLQKNQRIIWWVVGVVAAMVTVVALYNSYRDYTLNKAVLAYDKAMLIGDVQKRTAALQAVANDYRSTPSALWSRIALAHLEQEAGNTKAAIEKLTALRGELDEKSVLKPLILVNLGGLLEQEKQYAQAEKSYLQLNEIKGFEAMALHCLGRVYEALGSKEKAVEMYQQYLGLAQLGQGDQAADGATPNQGFPAQDQVRASLNRLLR